MSRFTGLLHVVTLLFIVCPAAADEGSGRKPDWGETDFRKFLPTLGHNFTCGLFTSDNLPPLFIGGVGTALAYNYDQSISDAVAGDSEGFGEAGQIAGGPVVMSSLIGACVIAAPFTQNDRFRAFSFTLGQAVIMDEVIYRSLKLAVDRTRPNGEDYSFPSGHAATTFMFATVVHHYYGYKLSVPAYVFAGLVSWSRVELGKHYLSDVIFGATLGYLTARTALRTQSNTASRLSFFPYAGPGSGGVVFVLSM
ncbi:MAG: phosphatase PAP2 family protein [Acidobacteriota bacterium]